MLQNEIIHAVYINYNDQYFDYILFTDLWKIQKEIKRSQIPTDDIDIEK